jgi:hypothetical protein
MNFKLKFLEIVLSDLVSKRDTLELDLNFILNKESDTDSRKKNFLEILNEISLTNIKIQTLSDYMNSISGFNGENNNNN